MTDLQRCIITSRHDPERTPKAVPSLYVCAGHRAKVERMIAQLPALDDDLVRMLTVNEKRDSEQGRAKHGAKAGGVSLNDNAVKARDELKAELVRIARHVADERGFTLPIDTVPAIATWLLRHVDWLCAQPDADETHDYLEALTNLCQRTAYPSGRRRFPLGEQCKAALFCDVETKEVHRCAGDLVALLMPDDDRENLSEIVCELCGTQVPASGWLTWATNRRDDAA